MNDYFQNLEITYQNELRDVIKSQCFSANKIALDLTLKYYLKMKQFVELNDFDCDSEEIFYFKYTKPKLHSQVFFFRRIIQIQSLLPMGSVETKKEYYSSHLQIITAFHEEHKEIIHYYRSHETKLDPNFFIRKNACLHRELESEFADVDYGKCTGYDVILAKFIAYEKLEHYVRIQMMNIDSIEPLNFLPGFQEHSSQALKPELKWSLSKIALIEVLHVFKAAGGFNDGPSDMKTIVKQFEYFLQIDLGDHYKGLNKIKDRKISKTKFMDEIIENFKKMLDDEDSY